MSKFRDTQKHFVFCGGFRPKCSCNARKQIHLRRRWPQWGAKPTKGVQLLTCYVHCNAIPAQTPLLFNLLSFRNGLALCSGQAGSHSCSASVRLDGAAVRKSALRSDWKSMLGISCLCSSAWRSCSVYRGFSGSPGPAAVLRHGIGAVGPLCLCQPAALQPCSLAALHTSAREVDTAAWPTRPTWSPSLTQTHRNNFHVFQSNSPGSAELNCFEREENCCFWLWYVFGSLISCSS